MAAVGLGKLDGQSAFRIASPSQLGVDECPDETNVLAYSQVLLAEAGTLVLSVTSLAAVGGDLEQQIPNCEGCDNNISYEAARQAKRGGGTTHRTAFNKAFQVLGG